ncbi:TIGR00341 family protein [Bacillus tianshenii]|nr:TIGR00341 family protein [Bacillus tianshenii]
MEMQLIEVYFPQRYRNKVDEILKKHSETILTRWTLEEDHGFILYRLMVNKDETEELLNFFENVSHIIDGFEVILHPIDTYIARQSNKDKVKKKEEKTHIQRASQQELYVTMKQVSKPDMAYILLSILSAIVVTIGIIKNSEAVVIGGMAIAPLIGPVISLAFASMLGDKTMAKSSLITVVFGLGISFLIAVAFGITFDVPYDSQAFKRRTVISMLDVLLALTAGAAGALSILQRFSSALVGVMVAVALLPPAAVVGLLTGGGQWEQMTGALLLTLVNVTCVLLSAILIFWVTGIRPATYLEKERASISTKYSFLFIAFIVVILVGAIWYSQNF